MEDRNRVLEELLHKTRIRVDFAVASLIEDVESMVPGLVFRGRSMDYADRVLTPLFSQAGLDILLAYQKMRRLAYTLAYVGEAEALARADDPSVDYSLHKTDIDEIQRQDSVFGGSLESRIRYYLDKLRRRVLDSIQLAILQGKTGDEAMADVTQALPKPKEVTLPRRTLTSKRVQEAERKGPIRAEGVNISSGFVDDDTWKELVDEYLAEFIPDDRTEDKVRYKGPYGRGTITRYEWELERDFTHDFVSLVRQGQLDVAKENGYTDFVWIAVLDNKTDECCTWRDGLTTAEIESQLKSAHKDDTCKTSVPPAHPFCRCDIAPVTDRIEDFKLPDIGDFETWLINP